MGRRSQAQEKAEVDKKRNILIMEEERVLNTYDDDSDIARARATGKFELERLIEPVEVIVTNETDEGLILEFDLLRVDAPIANALRRVLIAEVPTMAIEKIYLFQNTSVIQDEVLCHRIGLLPLLADPREFEWPKEKIIGINEHGVDCTEIPTPEPNVHLVFEINVTCSSNPQAPSGATEPTERLLNAHVYSKAFEWRPIGEQAERFAEEPPRMVHDDILVAKMRHGQQIEAICHCVKGIGRDHAKFSPVATASYRLLPIIELKRPVKGDAAQLFKECFSEGVVALEKDKHGEETAVIVDARRDTCSRNVLRHEELADAVFLAKQKDHFIFSVESTGALPSATLVEEACKVMESKCRSLKEAIAEALQSVE